VTLKIFISSAIISAIVATLGNIITAKIAQRTAEKTTEKTMNKEIQKMRIAWEREDIVSSDDEFASMAEKVSHFVYYNNGDNQEGALAIIAFIRSKENGDIAAILDELYQSVLSDDPIAANELLTKAINAKREIKSRLKSVQ